MTSTNFRQINNQAIIAPFWADMIYNSVSSLLFVLLYVPSNDISII